MTQKVIYTNYQEPKLEKSHEPQAKKLIKTIYYRTFEALHCFAGKIMRMCHYLLPQLIKYGKLNMETPPLGHVVKNFDLKFFFCVFYKT